MSHESNEKYCLRRDYEPNLETTSFEGENAGGYWTEERIETATEFQFDVYKLAYRLARQRGKQQRILDIGSGPPCKHSMLARLQDEFPLVLVDQPTVESLARRFAPAACFVGANLEDPPESLDYAPFDIVLCADVIEHLLAPEKVLQLIGNSLKPDGLAIISTPERERLYGKAQREAGHPQHVREWSYSELRAYLSNSGFEVIQHTVFPQKRTNLMNRIRYLCLGYLGIRIPEFSCQAAVCRRA